MASTDALNAQLANLIQRLGVVTAGMERIWSGSEDETVNNGAQDLLTQAGLIKKALEDVDGAVGGAITETLAARDDALDAALRAEAGALASGQVKNFYKSYAADEPALVTALPDLVDDAYGVISDETKGGATTRYTVTDHIATFDTALEPIIGGMTSADPSYQTLPTAEGRGALALNTIAKVLGDSIEATRLSLSANLDRPKPSGLRRVYAKTPWGTAGNLITNGDFAGSTTGWTLTNLTDASSNPLYSLVTAHSKTWLQIDQGTATGSGSRGYVLQTIVVPAELRNLPVVEVSFRVEGLYSGFGIDNRHYDDVNVLIEDGKSEVCTAWVNPSGASSLSIKLFKAPPGNEVSGQYVRFTEVQIREASFGVQPIDRGLPRTGQNRQLARWWTNWDEIRQRKELAAIAATGQMLRVWLSAEVLSSFADVPSPTKRTVPSSADLTDEYNAITTAAKPTVISGVNLDRLDWFFDRAREYGIKVHVCLFGGFVDGAGNPHATLSKPGSIELIDSDADVQAGYVALAAQIVERYQGCPNIIGWEVLNEGYLTWRYSMAGYSAAASYGRVRSLSFSGYRAWERAVVAAIRSADPYRPVILNTSTSDSAFHVLDADDVCDWLCPSCYIGAISFSFSGTPISGSPSTLTPDIWDSLQPINDVPLVAHAESGSVLPSGITEGATYYVVEAGIGGQSKFKLAAIPGGSPLSFSGGSGRFWLYSVDGSAVPFFGYFLERVGRHPKTAYLAEIGATSMGTSMLYRDDVINAAHLQQVYKLLQQYGIAGGLAWDETDLLFDESFAPTKGGRAVIAASQAVAVQDDVSRVLDAVKETIARTLTVLYASYQLPVRMGSKRLWEDGSYIRWRHGSDPSSASDGRRLSNSHATGGNYNVPVPSGYNSYSVRFADPLTANRAVSLPSDANVLNGDMVIVYRDAGATGAFSLTVGPTVLATAGTWCAVVYDSGASAWHKLMGGDL